MRSISYPSDTSTPIEGASLLTSVLTDDGTDLAASGEMLDLPIALPFFAVFSAVPEIIWWAWRRWSAAWVGGRGALTQPCLSTYWTAP